MVRFIMQKKMSQTLFFLRVYIPIWLDLLYERTPKIERIDYGLHSNMVRFIIYFRRLILSIKPAFTFQYGQIYYKENLEYLIAKEESLHSNMVRFIMFSKSRSNIPRAQFTFQYGQIYYVDNTVERSQFLIVYIPIWLDLLQNQAIIQGYCLKCLHSNMVRFIIVMKPSTTTLSSSVYIPIWLDLLSQYKEVLQTTRLRLHSNMVRFIIVNV